VALLPQAAVLEQMFSHPRCIQITPAGPYTMPEFGCPGMGPEVRTPFGGACGDVLRLAPLSGISMQLIPPIESSLKTRTAPPELDGINVLWYACTGICMKGECGLSMCCVLGSRGRDCQCIDLFWNHS